MPITNETLRKKLETRNNFLLNKIMPLQEELELTQKMLASLDEHEDKTVKSAEEKLGLGLGGDI